MGEHKFFFRKGTESDLPEIATMIIELAIYENSLDEKVLTNEQLIEDGSGADPQFETLLAVTEQGEIIGLALYFFTYSSWKGRTLYLEDLYVRESMRGIGIGKQLITALLEEARNRKARRLLLQANRHNHKALTFYQNLGAHLDPTWVNCSIPI